MSNDYVTQLLSEESEVEKKFVPVVDPINEEAEFMRMALSLQLNEQVNIVRLNKQTKTNSLANRMALMIARANKDPMYTKYAKLNGARLAIRSVIYNKYGSKALQRARAIMNKAATVATENSVRKK